MRVVVIRVGVPVLLALSALAGNAAADGPAALPVSGALKMAVALPPAASPVPQELSLPSGTVLASERPAADERKPSRPSAPGCGPEGCGYKALLGHIAICRDLEIPGAPAMAVRLLPTSRALAGPTKTPIVLRPRVDGGYGVHVAASF